MSSRSSMSSMVARSRASLLSALSDGPISIGVRLVRPSRTARRLRLFSVYILCCSRQHASLHPAAYPVSLPCRSSLEVKPHGIALLRWSAFTVAEPQRGQCLGSTNFQMVGFDGEQVGHMLHEYRF